MVKVKFKFFFMYSYVQFLCTFGVLRFVGKMPLITETLKYHFVEKESPFKAALEFSWVY